MNDAIKSLYINHLWVNNMSFIPYTNVFLFAQSIVLKLYLFMEMLIIDYVHICCSLASGSGRRLFMEPFILEGQVKHNNAVPSQ